MKKVIAILGLMSISLTAIASEEDISASDFLSMIKNNAVKASIANNYSLSNGKATQGPRSMGPMAPYEIKAEGKFKHEIIVLSVDDGGTLALTSCEESQNSVCK